MSQVLEALFSALSKIWLVVPIAIVVLLRDWWLRVKTNEYIEKMEWVLLEISIPKDNLRSVKAMEQVIASLHATYSFGIRKRDLYLKGKVEDWMSLEIVGFADGVHFYIRAPKGHRQLVETAVLSQYPDAEVLEVEDYVNRLKEKPFSHRDIFGADFVLGGPEYLPIRTYEYFEEGPEEMRIDPIATVTEVMSRLKNNETLWMQLLIRPTGGDWRKAGEEYIEELLGNKKDKHSGVIAQVVKDASDVITSLPSAPFSAPTFGEVDPKKGNDRPMMRMRSPIADEKMKAIGRKLSKPAFKSILRIIYIDDKNEFTGANVTSVMGALRQVGDQNMNQLVPNMKTMTIKATLGKLVIKRDQKLAKRKRLLMMNYIERAMPRPIQIPSVDLYLKSTVMVADEIATIFHPPTDLIKSERLKEIHSRKSQAPIDLPLKE